jgi:hypothetical protein
MKHANNRKIGRMSKRVDTRLLVEGLPPAHIRFEPEIQQDIQTYLLQEREKLQRLDKATAKKIVGNA